ncbi:MAG: rRNA maturation RNase YbeY [Gammaproteobacteria bacterium]|nr:rRNA maturation RNase YbeY [Gammaproteobacteria bacterium]
MNERLTIDVQVATTVASAPDEETVRTWVRSAAGPHVDGFAELSVRFVDEDESRRLNAGYRGKDRATNVLSFPADAVGLPPGAARPLGDLVVCGPVVEREAAEQGKAVADHWAHLLVHGTLHLLGYDHETDGDAAEMEALERRILASGGVADPYRD